MAWRKKTGTWVETLIGMKETKENMDSISVDGEFLKMVQKIYMKFILFFLKIFFGFFF